LTISKIDQLRSYLTAQDRPLSADEISGALGWTRAHVTDTIAGLRRHLDMEIETVPGRRVYKWKLKSAS
jgi:biotin operon repressor